MSIRLSCRPPAEAGFQPASPLSIPRVTSQRWPCHHPSGPSFQIQLPLPSIRALSTHPPETAASPQVLAVNEISPPATAEGLVFDQNRGDWIRTSGLCDPNAALCQAELRPVAIVIVAASHPRATTPPSSHTTQAAPANTPPESARSSPPPSKPSNSPTSRRSPSSAHHPSSSGRPTTKSGRRLANTPASVACSPIRTEASATSSPKIDVTRQWPHLVPRRGE